MTRITEDQREALDGVLTSLDVLHELLESVPMLRGQWDAIDQSRQAIEGHAMDAVGVQTWRRCEGCDDLIVTGDLVHLTEEGDDLCEDCAPTNGDVLRQYREIIAGIDSADEIVRHNAAVGVDDPDDLRERFQLLSAYSPEDLARKALTELT